MGIELSTTNPTRFDTSVRDSEEVNTDHTSDPNRSYRTLTRPVTASRDVLSLFSRLQATNCLPEIPPESPTSSSRGHLLEENRHLRGLLVESRTRINELERTLCELHRTIDASTTTRIRRLVKQKAALEEELVAVGSLPGPEGLGPTSSGRPGSYAAGQHISQMPVRVGSPSQGGLLRRNVLEANVRRLEQDRSKLNERIEKLKEDRVMSVRFSSKRANVIKEFYFTEKNYVEGLELLKNTYLDPILERRLMRKELWVEAFSNLEIIVQVNQLFLTSLEETLFTHARDEALVNLVLEFSDSFKCYSDYIAQYARSHQILTEQLKKRKVEKWINETVLRLREANDVGKEVTISGLLITPIQRLPRYLLLLKDLLKFTQSNRPQHAKLRGAIDVIQGLLEYTDQQSRQFQDRLRLIDLSKRLDMTLISKSLLFETSRVSRINSKSHRIPANLYLLSDLIAVQDTKKSKLRARAKQAILRLFVEEDVPSGSGGIHESLRSRRSAPAVEFESDAESLIFTVKEIGSEDESSFIRILFPSFAEMEYFLKIFEPALANLEGS